MKFDNENFYTTITESLLKEMLLLDHVEDCFVLVEPQVVVLDGHGLEGDFFGVFEVGVRPPDEVEPFDREQPILSGHVGGQDQPMVLPCLSKEHVRGVRLEKGKASR